jgi:hypothetical protein
MILIEYFNKQCERNKFGNRQRISCCFLTVGKVHIFLYGFITWF